MVSIAVAWSYVRRYWRIAVGLLIGAFAIVLAVALFAGRKRKSVEDVTTSEALADAIDIAKEHVAAARAQSAVEIAVARTQDAAIRTDLEAVLADPDGAARRRRLVELAKRVP